MNDISLLRQVRPDVTDPDPLVLARARLALRAPRPRRRVRRTLVAAVLAATLTAVILVSDVLPRGSSPGAIADARTFLTAVAERTATTPDEPIPAGGYRVVRSRTSVLATYGPQDHRYPLRIVNQVEWWIPAAQTPPYTAQVTRNLQREFLSETDEAWARAHDPRAFRSSRSVSPNTCRVLDDGGIKAVVDPRNGCDSWEMPSAKVLASLSRDPAKLLTQLTTLRISYDDPGDTAFDRLASILTSGTAPTDLRVALYQAARDIPGVTLVDGAVNLDGTTGRAISRETGGIRTELIIDPTTGRFLGSRQVVTQPNPTDKTGIPRPNLHQNETLTWTSVTTQTTTNPPPTR